MQPDTNSLAGLFFSALFLRSSFFTFSLPSSSFCLPSNFFYPFFVLIVSFFFSFFSPPEQNLPLDREDLNAALEACYITERTMDLSSFYQLLAVQDSRPLALG